MPLYTRLFLLLCLLPACADVPFEDFAADSTDDAISFAGTFKPVKPMGYGEVRNLVVTQSAAGRTGQWWCDNHFGKHLSGQYKCRSVSGSAACGSTVPNKALVSCSKYKAVKTVDIGGGSAAGRTGQWWCNNHFGKHLGGTWDCRSVSGGACGAVAPNNSKVTCGRYTPVNTAPFRQKACNAPDLATSERVFCDGPDYMRTRTASTTYLYNDYVRIGLNQSYGGTVFELYGVDKVNRIEEHGGAAVQMSIWGFDRAGSGSGYFKRNECRRDPYPTLSACERASGSGQCIVRPLGRHVNNCVTVNSCARFAAADAWNPIQAQGVNCTWSGPSNDVTSIVGSGNGVKMTRVNPYNYTKSSKHPGLTWSVKANVPNGVPYAALRYTMDYTGIPTTIVDQEIPAIYADADLSAYYYFYAGDRPYANPRSRVTRTASAGARRMPNRTGKQPKPNSKFPSMSEDWLSACNKAQTKCLTVATFAPEAKLVGHDNTGKGKSVITFYGRFGLDKGHHSNWVVYLFPYRYDQVIGGKSVREWIYKLGGH